MINIVKNLWETEVECIENKYKLKEYELKSEIERLNNKIKNMEKEHSKYEVESTRIRWDDTGKYYNLKDFCRVTRDLLFIKENELKQWLKQQDILKIENDKYIPNCAICILVDGELYISYEFIREKIMTLRTLIFLGDNENIDEAINIYKKNKKVLIEQMANTVYVECKQRSVEFKEHRENKFFIGE